MQSVDLSSNYFALFDLPESFDVDLQVLTERYRALQRTIHPDRFANAAESERRLSMQMAAHINEGYQVLNDSLSRSRYLLELNGIELNDLETGFDEGFLMEQMDLRERLSEVRDSIEPQKKLYKIIDDINDSVGDITKQLADLFEESGADSLDQAKELTRKLQFFSRLKEEANAIDDDLTDY